MNRRSFIKHTGHALAIPGLFGSMGFGLKSSFQIEHLLRMAMTSGNKLVMIFLDGGNDGLNTVIPLSQLSELNQVRPHVMLPENKLIQLPLQYGLGLHPALTDFKSLFLEGRLQIIQSVGYPQPNFSHFRSSDIWMSASDSDKLINTGWMGRYLEDEHPEFPDQYPSEMHPDPLAIEIGFGASMIFQGDESNLGMVINGPDSFYDLVNDRFPDTPDTRSGNKMKYVQLIARQSQAYRETILKAFNKNSSQQAYPETELARQLQIIARLIAGGLNTSLYLVRISGFDTHAEQVDVNDKTQGMHTSLLKELNDGVMAFQRDIDQLGIADQVMGMTFSEFGRKIISNASNGTDHGTAAPLFVFGNAVKGGIVGENPTIDPKAEWYSELDLQYDFRQVYAGVLQQWLGVSASQTSTILNGAFEPIEIIGKSDVITGNTAPLNESPLAVYPNPIKDSAMIVFQGKGGYVRINLFGMDGRFLNNIYEGKVDDQMQKLQWNAENLPSGQYLIFLESNQTRQTFRVIKS